MKLLAVLTAFVGVIYWWWSNRKGSWWVWDLSFWPEAVSKDLVQSSDGSPLVISLRCVVVNIGILPKVITEVDFTLSPIVSTREFKFKPYGLMGSNGFLQNKEGVWTNDRQEMFRPLVVKERAHESFHLLFAIDGPNQVRKEDLLAGMYKGLFEYKRARVGTKSIVFYFNITEHEVRDFQTGVPFVISQRNFIRKSLNKSSKARLSGPITVPGHTP